MRYVLLLLCCAVLASCWPKKPIPGEYENVKRWAWKPVYGLSSQYKKITWHNTARPVTKAGKIYVLGNRIYQNDIGTGIHVIDNSNPATAHRIAFIEIPGNTDLSIKNQHLFANNYMDIIEIDISNPGTAVEKSRIKNAFNVYDEQRPYVWQAPADSGFYKCPDMYVDSVVVTWVRDSIYNAYCYKN